MFIIKNVSKNEIGISDLNVHLSPGQQTDLHEINLKIDPLKSRDLKTVVDSGLVSVVKYDVEKTKQTIVEKIIEKQSINKDEIINGLKEEINKSIANSNADLMKQLLGAIQNIQVTQNIITNNNVQKKINNEQQLDESTLLKIHERTINKLKVTSVSGNIEVKGKVQKSNINTDDLQDLI